MNPIKKKLIQKREKLTDLEAKVKLIKQEIKDLEEKQEIENLKEISRSLKQNNMSSSDLQELLKLHRKGEKNEV